jgi:integrase
MARRDYGDGSLYQRKSDGRWTGSFRLPDGARKSVYAPKDNNKKEVARALLKEAQKQAERGELIATTKQTLSEYLEYWLSVKKLAIKGITYVHYRSHLRSRVIPAIGNLKLQKLTTAQVQGCVNAMVVAKMKPGTIRLIYSILHEALEDAITWKLLAANPCKGVIIPRQGDDEMQALTAEQAQALLDAARGTDLEGLITLALATGLRRGELFGLKWSDVDFERGCLRVQRTVVYVNGEGYKEVSPKTKSGKRSITLTGFALMALKEHRTRQRKIRMQSLVWEDKDLIFPTATGMYMSASTLFNQFHSLLERAGLPSIRFHDLRHSCATLLLKMKVPPKVVQEILGHSSIVITMDIYGHVLPGMQEEAMESYDALFSSSEASEKEAQ